MSMSCWSAAIRWFPWRRRVRAHAVLESWPRMVDGPVSLLARLGWSLVGVPLLVLWAVELLAGALLVPCALLARGAGWSPWWVELRVRGCLGGLVRVRDRSAAKRVRAAVAAEPLVDPLEVLAPEHDYHEVEISARRWASAVRDVSGHGRRRWLPWRRRTSVRDALEWFPDWSLDEPVGLLLAVPFLLVAVCWSVVAGLELVAALVLLPFVLLLRSVRLLDWPIELVRAGEVSAHRGVAGLGASARARRELTEQVRVVVPRPRAAEPEVVAAR